MKKKIELLAPAGSMQMAQTALNYGADAIYAGQPRYSLRVRNNDFSSYESIKLAIDTAHNLNKQFYLVSNILPHNAKVKTFLNDIEPVIELKPDALIMADPGLVYMVKEKWPETVIHLSVQANTVNYAACKFWYKNGIKRIILSRELGIEEIAEIKQQCPEMEIEVFIHGALCIAYSGRCLLSGYFNHRDPNQGACTNSCRWQYDVSDATENPTGDIVKTNLKTKPIYLIEEKHRPGELMPIEEDEHGSYIMNSKDLRAIEYVDQLIKIGVDSLKIEGRTKSPYYVARTVQTYKKAIQDAYLNKPFDMNLLLELEELANRGYTSGFYSRHPDSSYQNYINGNSNAGKSIYCGNILDYKDGYAFVEAKNKIQLNDVIDIIHHDGNIYNTIITEIFDQKFNPISELSGSGHFGYVKLPLNKQNAFLAQRNYAK